ncbi:MAG: hypothetical protein HYX40_08235 [Sphingobacteriales bacterium]|nr:hypothetical protein [Sphingobacteriales bacterium]
MRQNPLFCVSVLLLLFQLNSAAQGKYPVAKMYAFKQKKISGINKKAVDPDGKKVAVKANSLQYLFYLECWPGKEIKVTAIWIKGIAYNTEAEKITAPVIAQKQIKTTSQPDTLVPETSNNVISVEATTKKANTISVSGKQLSASNEILIVYEWGNKAYYLAVKSVKEIAPQINK